MSRRSHSLVFGTILILATAGSVLASGGSGSGGSGGTGGGGTCGCISLAVSKETAPPGALSQMKVSLTEPKPISTGTGTTSFTAFDSLVGIALASHSKDAVGTAVIRGTTLGLSVLSPLATFGDTIDYPILTVVGHVPAGTPIGTKFPFNIDPASVQFYDSSGATYPVEVRNGFLVAGNLISIGDVNPGSAIVPAGGVVTITGVGFVPGTTVKFAEANIASVQYVSPTQLNVTVATTANMHGMMIKASNPDGTSDTYFSYQRTRAMSPSSDPVMQLVMPLVPPNEVTSAKVAIPAPAASTTYGIALQNIEPADTAATVNLLDGAGNVVATAQLTVTANHYIVRELSELFGAAPAAAATVSVTSAAPIEVLGVSADQVAGTAKPIAAQ